MTGCTAVGSYGSVGGTATLAWAWNGTGWTLGTTPNPTGASYSALDGVSCTTTSACTAVGTFNNGPPHVNSAYSFTLAERWNGRTWTLQSTPNLGYENSLTGASCTSTSACTAVGYVTYRKCVLGCTLTQNTLAEAWNGTTWAIQPTMHPGQTSELTGVSCTSTNACIAVGHYTSSGTQLTLAENWNGTSWATQNISNPNGATSSDLEAVSCTAISACTTVGHYTSGSTQLTLAERWNGTSWAIQNTPNPTGAVTSTLTGVSCTSTNAWTGVGTFTNSSGTQHTLAERWDGTSWAIQNTPNPAGATNSNLTSVSCTTSACTAAGMCSRGLEVGQPLGERSS